MPHEYRAHAASIAGDAAKLMAGFDEVDRLVKLESGAMELEDGTCDLRAALAATVDRLERVLRARNAGFTSGGIGFSLHHPAWTAADAMAMCWRLLATAAGALAPGEKRSSNFPAMGRLSSLTSTCRKICGVATPIPLARDSGGARSALACSARRFAFRLAEAEAVAAGGSLTCEGDRATLRLPVLTSQATPHSTAGGIAGGLTPSNTGRSTLAMGNLLEPPAARAMARFADDTSRVSC